MSSNLNSFQLRTLRIIAMLLEKDAVDDHIIDELWQNELDFFSLLEKNRLLSERINIDEKTGLLKHNQNYLAEIVKTASRIMSSLNRNDINISFVRFDIDNFSSFNNIYGHDLGDEVLVKISSLIKERSRPTDYAIRFGGEEIDIILPSTPSEGAEIYATKILQDTEKLRFSYYGEDSITTTMSAGISSTSIQLTHISGINDLEKKYRELQKQADDALYEAKLMGKNRCAVYTPDRQHEYRKIRIRYQKSK